MSQVINKATIIIRSSNERTELLCNKLIVNQSVSQENVFIVREVPFSATMKKSFEIGLSNQLPWTFCVDADVLLRPGSVEYLLNLAEKQKKNVCEMQGMIIDKFFGGPRHGGVHLYRTSLLKEVMKRIPEEGVDIRPEFHTLQAMHSDGYPYLKVPYIVGLHDEEQYNFDIYRKCFIHGTKHIHHVKLFSEVWKSKLEEDFDFRVALKALSDGILNTKPVYIDKDLALFKDYFLNAGFNEKSELDINKYSLDKIEQIIQNWEEPQIYLDNFPTKWGLEKSNRFTDIKSRYKTHGLFKTIYYIIGRSLKSIGSRILHTSDL